MEQLNYTHRLSKVPLLLAARSVAPPDGRSSAGALGDCNSNSWKRKAMNSMEGAQRQLHLALQRLCQWRQALLQIPVALASLLPSTPPNLQI